MRAAKTLGAKAVNWELMRNSIKPHLVEMPHLQELHDGLDEVIGEAKILDSQQEAARGSARDFTRKRQEIEQRGESLRRRVAAHLRGTFGFASDQLVQFGVNPRPRQTKPRKAAPPPAAPAPGASAPKPTP
jgi:hypothetical protein